MTYARMRNTRRAQVMHAYIRAGGGVCFADQGETRGDLGRLVEIWETEGRPVETSVDW